MTVKPKLRSAPTPDTILSFPSKGPVLDEHQRTITNDHSTLMDVGGEQAWLHNDRHSFDGKEVHVRHAHAVDMNLVDPPENDDTPEIGNQPDSAPTTHLGTGQSGHKPDDVDPLGVDKDKGKTVSAMSNTRPDDRKPVKH